MQSKEAAFRELIASKGDIIGEFKNKHGEVYILYRLHGVAKDLVTGDELDWEIGWYWERYSYVLNRDFILTSEEQDGLEKIINAEERKKKK